MVQLDIKVEGQRGHMIIQEDGTIIGSTGELSSNETTSQQITCLMTHSFPVDFNASKRANNGNGDGNGTGNLNPAAQDDNGAVVCQPINGSSVSEDIGKTWKWNRITVRFPEQSFVACLSNRKVHVVKRDNETNVDVPPTEET